MTAALSQTRDPTAVKERPPASQRVFSGSLPSELLQCAHTSMLGAWGGGGGATASVQ